MATTFLGDPDGSQTARRIDLLTRTWDPTRTWGARDRGRWVATLRTEERSLTIPGLGDRTGDLRVDALTNVTVAGTHRRRATRVRQVEREEFAEVAPAVYAAARRRRAGQIDRDAGWWDRVLGQDGYPPSEELPPNWFVHEDADLEITQRALASIYLGGFRLRQLLLSGAAREHAPGALARVDLMFSIPLPPWTWF